MKHELVTVSFPAVCAMAPPARAELPSKEVLSTVTTEVVPKISIAPPFPSASRDCEKSEF